MKITQLFIFVLDYHLLLKMRVRLPRVLSALCLSTAALLMWTIVKYATKQNFTQTCHHSEEFQEGLHQLADRLVYVYLFFLRFKVHN